MPFKLRAKAARADTMLLMLPTTTDNGARLAAILPTALASLALGLGHDASETLHQAMMGRGSRPAQAVGSGDAPDTSSVSLPAGLQPIRSFVLVVVDGLGHANLKAMAGHARTLGALPTRRIETVIPSTTGAALTTITTGRLPGEHGLLGYKIRHPQLGLVTTLKDWQHIEKPREWQRAEPLFGLAGELGVRPVAIGRPAHATGGLTESILAGTEYHGGQTIAERFSIASKLLRGDDPILAYLYVDELDKVAHSDGWQSDAWLRRLEQLDAALDDLLRTLPGDVGIVVTADHGIIDVEPERRICLDDGLVPTAEIEMIGGEPRFRSLYLRDGASADAVAEGVASSLRKLAWVGTRDEAVRAGWFGPVAPAVEDRLGEVLVIARGQHAFTLREDPPSALAMVGQHGGLSDEERGVPLALGGSLAGSGFASAVAAVAQASSGR